MTIERFVLVLFVVDGEKLKDGVEKKCAEGRRSVFVCVHVWCCCLDVSASAHDHCLIVKIVHTFNKC